MERHHGLMYMRKASYPDSIFRVRVRETHCDPAQALWTPFTLSLGHSGYSKSLSFVSHGRFVWMEIRRRRRRCPEEVGKQVESVLFFYFSMPEEGVGNASSRHHPEHGYVGSARSLNRPRGNLLILQCSREESGDFVTRSDLPKGTHDYRSAPITHILHLSFSPSSLGYKPHSEIGWWHIPAGAGCS